VSKVLVDLQIENASLLEQAVDKEFQLENKLLQQVRLMQHYLCVSVCVCVRERERERGREREQERECVCVYCVSVCLSIGVSVSVCIIL